MCIMTFLQLVSQLIGICNDFFSRFYFFCNDRMDCFEAIASGRSRLQREHDFCKLQRISFSNVARHVARKIAPCNTSLHCAIVASPKMLRDKLQRGHIIRCNLPAICLATPLHCVTFALCQRTLFFLLAF